MLVCGDCGLTYEVIWNNDGQEAPTVYCPRCGSDELTEKEE